VSLLKSCNTPPEFQDTLSLKHHCDLDRLAVLVRGEDVSASTYFGPSSRKRVLLEGLAIETLGAQSRSRKLGLA
jgi:hypothetical protein